jgi:hypothetical protein
MTMHRTTAILRIGIAVLMISLHGVCAAKLPSPTPEQVQAAAAKKAQADSQAEKDKQELAAAMDAVAKRWRARAAANGWPTRPPTPVASIQGFNASANQSGPSGQPDGRQGSAALQAPIRSEKSGTASPSADVKQAAPGNPK